MAYKMKRGSRPPFKMMGSSPYKEETMPDNDPPEIVENDSSDNEEVEINLPEINSDTTNISDSTNRGNLRDINRPEFENLDQDKVDKYKRVQQEYEDSINNPVPLSIDLDDTENETPPTEREIKRSNEETEKLRNEQLKIIKEGGDPWSYEKTRENPNPQTWNVDEMSAEQLANFPSEKEIGPDGGFYYDKEAGEIYHKGAAGAIDYDPTAFVPGMPNATVAGKLFQLGMKGNKFSKPFKRTIKDWQWFKKKDELNPERGDQLTMLDKMKNWWKGDDDDKA